MKNITCSQARWRNFIENLLEMAQGNLSKKLSINRLNDDFESVEVLLNMVSDEWKQRVLQMNFTKPIETQKFINHFQIILDKTLIIQDTDELFPRFLKIDPEAIYGNQITDFINPLEHEPFIKYFEQVISNQNRSFETLSVTVLGTPFLYSVKRMDSGGGYMLNLFQIHLDSKYFRDTLPKKPLEVIKLKQKKRYQDIVSDIKLHIDQMILSDKLVLKPLCKDFGINILLLKRGFRELYQCSAYYYFLTLRMKHAYMLIETSTTSLKEISRIVGYCHYASFSSQFFKMYSIRPKELRTSSIKNYNSINTEEEIIE